MNKQKSFDFKNVHACVCDVVLIVNLLSPRYSQPRGKIKKTYRGTDNQVRVVNIETTRGVLRRPTSKIIVLMSSEAAAASCSEV
ncbi:hypothetical protein EVAR_17628_1 [Eumeta japonica]|uniref:DUF5641 domain-containing protein n=1 Tax=Eumeta variegata TaxID=151549 RepID=A0A4C1UTE5_EUMVA|nr:hypothetical protein EVAR_17628_1 [Eumeta japonica]